MLTLPCSAAQASRLEGARVRKAAEWESNPFASFCARLHAAEGVSSALDRLEVAPPPTPSHSALNALTEPCAVAKLASLLPVASHPLAHTHSEGVPFLALRVTLTPEPVFDAGERRKFALAKRPAPLSASCTCLNERKSWPLHLPLSAF